MKDFLRKIKLLEEVEIELETQRLTFLKGWETHVDFGGLNPFFNFFEIFSSSKNDYVGQIDANSFKLRKRRRMFDSGMNMAVAKGNYRQEGGVLLIDMEVNGFSPFFIPFFIFIVIIYLAVTVFAVTSNLESALFILPFLSIHACFMIGIPYLFLRRSVKKMARDLEKEFFFMTKHQ